MWTCKTKKMDLVKDDMNQQNKKMDQQKDEIIRALDIFIICIFGYGAAIFPLTVTPGV